MKLGSRNKYVGMLLGLIIGIALAVALNDIAIGIAVGIVFVAGSLIRMGRKKDQDE